MIKSFLLKYWKWVIMVALTVTIILLVFVRCGHKPELSTTHADTIYIPGDSIPYKVYVDKPYPVYIDNTDTLWREQKVDTVFILKDYHSKKWYSILVKDDTSAMIRVNARVYKNAIDSIGAEFQNRRLTQMIVTNTTTIGEIPSNKLYLGAGLETNIKPFFSKPSITLNGLLVLKKHWAYEAEVLFPLNNIKDMGVGIKAYYKISFKKN